ncbi:hypothetical protein CLAIMM_02012 [Cladophialophora immunda]|nr:hypothetical protein CLAIMM_02012 [Cladophialophora immunda]
MILSRSLRSSFGRQRSPLAASFQKQLIYTGEVTRPRLVTPTLSDGLGRRRASSEAGDDETGHIQTAKNEGIFFFDNVFPQKINCFTRCERSCYLPPYELVPMARCLAPVHYLNKLVRTAVYARW